MRNIVILLTLAYPCTASLAADSASLIVPDNLIVKKETIKHDYVNSKDKLNFTCGDIRTQGNRGIAGNNLPIGNCVVFSIDYE
jgi:hypothetical protein